MKVSKIKNRVNEGFFSDLVQGKAKFGPFIGQNAELRNDPRIINEVATKGFLDFRDRLTKAGINLKNAASISTPEAQETIKVNLIEYVREYVTGGETQKNKITITTKLEKFPLPAKFDERTIYKYFLDAATLRADIVISSDEKLPVNDIIKAIKILQSNIPNDNEIVFPFNGAEVIIRKNKENSLKSGIYITDWTRLGTTLAAPRPETIYPRSTPVYELTDNDKNEAAHNEHEKNIEKIYRVYVNTSPRPDPVPFTSTFVQDLQNLQQSLEDDEEVYFKYNFPISSSRSGTRTTKVVIRKNNVYVSNYIASSTGTVMPEKTNISPHGEMYGVKLPKNLEEIYKAYENKGKPAARIFKSSELE
jgi:hypothetical protein